MSNNNGDERNTFLKQLNSYTQQEHTEISKAFSTVIDIAMEKEDSHFLIKQLLKIKILNLTQELAEELNTVNIPLLLLLSSYYHT